MELDNRIVEYWLLPAGIPIPAWSHLPTVPPINSGRALPSCNQELVEFMEYNWAAFAGTGGNWALISNSLLEPSVIEIDVAAFKAAGQPKVESISDQVAVV